MKILQVSKKLMRQIIDTRVPSGKLYTIDNGVYVACDNKNGEAFVEEFKDFNGCE